MVAFLTILALISLICGAAMIVYAIRLPGRRPQARPPSPRQVVYPYPPSYPPGRPPEIKAPPIPPPSGRREEPRRTPVVEEALPTPEEIFSKDPEEGFAAQFQVVEQTLEKLRTRFSKIDKTFAERVLKNTGADVQNHLMAKELIAALEKKRSLMIWYQERGENDPRTAFDIGFGKMAVATSPVGSQSAETTAYMDLAEVEREFERIVKSFQRRKTFYNVLRGR